MEALWAPGCRQAATIGCLVPCAPPCFLPSSQADGTARSQFCSILPRRGGDRKGNAEKEAREDLKKKWKKDLKTETGSHSCPSLPQYLFLSLCVWGDCGVPTFHLSFLWPRVSQPKMTWIFSNPKHLLWGTKRCAPHTHTQTTDLLFGNAANKFN